MNVEVNIVHCEGCNSSRYKAITRNYDYGSNTCDNEFEFVQCLDCNLVYLRNRPVTSEIQKIYPKSYQAHTKKHNRLLSWIRSSNQLKKYNALLKYISNDSIIYEYGCGSGEYLLSIVKSKKHSGLLIGSDFSDVAKLEFEKNGIQFRNPTFFLPEYRGQIGAIVMNQVIEHLENPNKIIEQAYELLKPGGVLVIETPSTEGIDYDFLGIKYWGGWHTPRHFFIFNPDIISSLCKKFGFKKIEQQYIMSPYLWAQTINFYLTNKCNHKKIAGFFDIKNIFFLICIGFIEYAQLLIRKKTSNYRIIFRK